METFLQVLTILRNLSWSLYIGLMISFALLQAFSQATNDDYLRWFRRFGVILGLSLGGSILSSIILIWFERGHYYPVSTMETGALTVGFALWVSNIVLEIWTLDPIRKHDLNILDDSLSIENCQQKALRHVQFQGLLCVMTACCFWAV